MKSEVFAKALGLSYWNPEKMEKELWARAWQGDQLSQAILSEMLSDEAEKEKLQKSRKSGWQK